MDTEYNKDLVRRFYEEVVNTGNTEKIADFISPDLIETDDVTRVHSGIQGMIEDVRGVRNFYPDLRLPHSHAPQHGKAGLSITGLCMTAPALSKPGCAFTLSWVERWCTVPTATSRKTGANHEES